MGSEFKLTWAEILRPRFRPETETRVLVMMGLIGLFSGPIELEPRWQLGLWPICELGLEREREELLGAAFLGEERSADGECNVSGEESSGSEFKKQTGGVNWDGDGAVDCNRDKGVA